MSKFKKWFLTNTINPMFDNVDSNDYFFPINSLYKMHNINKSYTKLDDEVISYYIKSMKNISIIVVYPPALKHPLLIKTMIKSLEENGKIHYIKDINMNYYMMYNTIYQLYSYEKRMKSNTMIMDKVKRLHFDLDSTHDIRIIVYSLYNKELKLNGKSVEYKMFLREIFLNYDIQKLTENNMSHPKSYDYLHVSDNDMMAYDYAGLFFNKNSLRFLKKQKSWRMLEFPNGKNYLNHIKSFILTRYSQMEMEKLLIISSGVLYSYGIRDMNDLDCILLESNKIKNPSELNEIVVEGIDISYQPILDKLWEDELNTRAIQLGASNYAELVINPHYYYYFMGFKFLRLKYEIIIRYKRQRPAQFTDLLVIRQMFRLKYSLTIPIETKMYDKLEKKDIIKKINPKEYIDTIRYYLKTRYYINLKSFQIIEWINNNIQDGGNISNKEKDFTIIDDVSNREIIYPTLDNIIKMGYDPRVIIYSSDKPYLYPGEEFNIKGCIFKQDEIIQNKSEKNLRIVTFNVHNFIKRCNSGIAPLFNTSINPFETPRDVMRFIDFFKKMNADILCLQELVPIINKKIKKDITDFDYIRDNFNFLYLNEMMNMIGYTYHIIGPTQQGHIIDKESNLYYYLANGIYSKYKFEKSIIYSYNFINRNSIIAKIKWNGKNINIYCNHWEYIIQHVSPSSNETCLLVKQSNVFTNILNNNNYNTILCGDFNINIFHKKEGVRYNKWEEKTKFLRENFISTNKSQIATNFSQLEQTDFIMLSKKNNMRVVYSTIIKTDISDHYAILTDFI